MNRLVTAAAIVALLSTAASSQSREDKLRADKRRFDSKREWIYNNLDQAYIQAQTTGKPILVVLRCIPCEECVKLDDDLIDNNPLVEPLMDRFVRVRVTSTNGLDLKTFQYDTDQSFAVFFLSADKVVYGRFGTRSHRTEWQADVSVEGMARAMEGALKLHEQYPGNRAQLAAKSRGNTEVASPERFPTLRQKPASLNWEGRNFVQAVSKNCIHCHEISEARMELYWKKRQPIPEQVMYPYPHPKSVGLILDPGRAATVTRIDRGSPAEKANFKRGDEIVSLNGQPLISMADVQWVLHHLPASAATVQAEVLRSGRPLKLTMSLPAGWRRLGDTRWRTGHWILRRSMLGGMKLNSGGDSPGAGPLRVEYIGDWGPFGVAKRAGIQKGDTVVSVDGRTGFRREADVMDYINQNKRSGDQVRFEMRRGSRRVTAQYRIQ